MTQETKDLLCAGFKVVVAVTTLAALVLAFAASTAGDYAQAAYFMASAGYLNTLD